uniref:Protein artemis n=1 Tax=Brachionus koreanus TaxID=1199090 RepID=A0A7G7WNH3_9BILA|nr:artemis [Brachionus koreanus]
MTQIPKPTKKLLTKDVTYFHGAKQKKIASEKKTNISLKKDSSNSEVHEAKIISLKEAKFDVFNFGIKGLEKTDQDNAKMKLAIKLGAKPLKNNATNYKEFLQKKKQEASNKDEINNKNLKSGVSSSGIDFLNKKNKLNFTNRQMNNFDGQLQLYPEICIDNFSSDVLFNPRIRCFILTHFHDDHMKNLEDLNFLRILRDNSDKVKFFCSSVTKDFIKTCDKYSHLKDFCNIVPADSPFIINISTTETVTITFSGSGHCPGSVMAFIEGLRGNVLFTGDFRLPSNSTSKLAIFNDSLDEKNQNQLKSVDNLYIDMTFFKPSYPRLPSREESVNALIIFLKDFLELDKKTDFKNLVYLKTSARIGYEFVFQEINRSTGFKIHVNNLIYHLYDKIPAIKSIFTLDPYETPIHSCIFDNRNRKSDTLFEFERKKKLEKFDVMKSKNKPLIPCLIEDDKANEFKIPVEINAVKIILSAMYFTDNPGIDKIFIEFKPSKNERHFKNLNLYKKIFRLCYSFHSSMEEIVSFVNSLRPKRIHPIALPDSTSESSITRYFFDNQQKFTEFHLGHKNKKICINHEKFKNNSSDKKFLINDLILRKRNTFNGSSLEKQLERNSSSEDSNGSEDDSLIFNDLKDDLSIKKKSHQLL